MLVRERNSLILFGTERLQVVYVVRNQTAPAVIHPDNCLCVIVGPLITGFCRSRHKLNDRSSLLHLLGMWVPDNAIQFHRNIGILCLLVRDIRLYHSLLLLLSTIELIKAAWGNRTPGRMFTHPCPP